jgi:2-iminobutanoate/2-iminopropanoate deaminase
MPWSTFLLSPARGAGESLFVLGWVGVSLSTRETLKRIAGLTRQCLDNIKGLPTAGGTSLAKVVKMTMLITNIEDFANTNDVYHRYFSTNPLAHAYLEVKSPAQDGSEIECVAAI